MHNTELNGDK